MSLLGRVLNARIPLLLSCLVIGAMLSVALGQDASWDLKNYHLYNAWAALNDRAAHDFAAAGMQSYFNPLADLPYYLLGSGLLKNSPRLLSACQGLWYGLLLFTLFVIARRLAKSQQRTLGWPDLLAVLIGATGTMYVSQAGLSSNEVPLACLILIGLAQLMPLYDAQRPAAIASRVFLAGMCGGLAVGLKPTGIIYPPAIALALLLTLRPTLFAWRLVFVFVAGNALTFALSYGWWGWHLYQLTGNPIFPLFNQIFHSDWVASINGTDSRFRPRNLGQWLFYPFYWIKRAQSIVTEVRFADPRYALTMLALIAIALRPLFAKRRPASAAFAPGATGLLAVFVASAYVAWLVLFSILRYAVPIEALTGLIMLSAIHAFIPARSAEAPRRPYAATAGMATLLLLICALTRYPNWGHTPYTAQPFEVAPEVVEPNSMVLILGGPHAYLAPFFQRSEDIAFVGVTWFTRSAQGYKLHETTKRRIAEHKGPFYVVRRDDAGEDLVLLAQFMDGYRETDCHPIRSPLERDKRGRDDTLGLRLCRVEQG
jgi:hypothetical protein